MEPTFIEEMRAQERVRCIECQKPVLDSEDFIQVEVRKQPLNPDGIGRIHRECKRKRDEQEKQQIRETRKETERLIRERDEEEHSLRPRRWHLRVTKDYYGLKKDLEALEKEANEIIEALAKKHNLTTEKKD